MSAKPIVPSTADDCVELGWELFNTTYGLSLDDAMVRAIEQQPELLAFAAAWDREVARPLGHIDLAEQQWSSVPAPHRHTWRPQGTGLPLLCAGCGKCRRVKPTPEVVEIRWWEADDDAR